MAEKTIPHVHLETMVEAENQGTEPSKIGSTGETGLPMGEYASGLLAGCRKSSAVLFHNKRKARTSRVF